MVTSGQIVRLADSGKEMNKRPHTSLGTRLLVPKYRPSSLHCYRRILTGCLHLQCSRGLASSVLSELFVFMEPQKGPTFTIRHSTPVLAPFLSRSLGRLPTLCRAFGTLSGRAREGRKTLADLQDGGEHRQKVESSARVRLPVQH